MPRNYKIDRKATSLHLVGNAAFIMIYKAVGTGMKNKKRTSLHLGIYLKPHKRRKIRYMRAY